MFCGNKNIDIRYSVGWWDGDSIPLIDSMSLKKKKKNPLSFLSFNKWAKEAHLCKHLYNIFCKQFLHNDK